MRGLMVALPSGLTKENSAHKEDSLNGSNNGHQQELTLSSKLHQEEEEMNNRVDEQDEEENK
eukprot:7492004-Ditylum_brightwellii.AAC.1